MRTSTLPWPTFAADASTESTPTAPGRYLTNGRAWKICSNYFIASTCSTNWSTAISVPW